MGVRLLLFTVVTALIVGAPASAATLPHRTLVGPAQGVQAAVSGKSVTIRFTGASAAWGKKRAGQPAFVVCTRRPEPRLFFQDDGTTSPLTGTSSTGFEDPSTPDTSAKVKDILAELGLTRLSSSGASVKAKLREPKADVCEVRVGYSSSADAAYAVLTPRGAVALDEDQRGLRMGDVIYAASPKRAYRSAAEVVALGGGEVVALDDPNGTPPAGKIGYWSKGRAVSLVSASVTGRRLAIQDLGGGMLRTNAFEQLLSWSPAEAPKGSSTSALSGDDTSDEDDEELSAFDGLFARLEGDEVVFRFTGKAAKVYRRLAGRRVVVSCMKAPPRPLLGEVPSWGTPAVTRLRVRAHGGTIRGRAPVGRNDLCTVETEGGADVADGAFTPAGRRYLIDFIVPLLFLFDDRMPWELATTAATRYPGVATILAAHQGLTGLTSPGGPLKAGQVGIWTDASEQALIALGAPDGHRYLIADEGAGQVRTNAFIPWLSSVAALNASGTGLPG